MVNGYPYNTNQFAGIRPIYDAALEDERLIWNPCEYPIQGILRETAKAKLIKLSDDLAVWIPKKVIYFGTTDELLRWLPLKGYTFGGDNGEFFVKL